MIEHGPLLERLLEGEFICAVSDQQSFHKLQNQALVDDLNHFLRPLNRRVAQNDEGSVYFLAYCDLTPNARQQVSQQFAHSIQALLPMLEWMQLVQEALGRDGALSAGDTIKLQDFESKVVDNQSLIQRLGQLAQDKTFKSTSEKVDMQIKQVFKRIKELGYLHQPHKDRLFYIVTGKIDHLIELVRFIKDEENLPIDEDQPEQEAMF
ncbi:condensin complex protein MksE [Paraglaciecola aestuariivivens]